MSGLVISCLKAKSVAKLSKTLSLEVKLKVHTV